jgi:hypothetical protein
MKFEEKNATLHKVKKYKQLDHGYIYFLMQGREVVYVGQTRVGISRPLTHTDKEFDSFYMKKCALKFLDKKEREMILKYRPKYNNGYNNDKTYIGRTKLCDELEKNGIRIRTVFLDRAIKELGIKEIGFGFHRSIAVSDKNKVIKYIKENYKKIKEEEKISLSHFFINGNDKQEELFCLFCVNKIQKTDKNFHYGAKSIKDLYYMGEISEEFIKETLIEYKNKK